MHYTAAIPNQHRTAKRSHSLVTPLCLITFTLLVGSTAGAQTTNPTDGGIPSGLEQGGQSSTSFENINFYNGNVALRLDLLDIVGRGGARASIALARNSIHWVVEKYQDRNHITYTPKKDFKDALRLPFYEPVRLYLRRATGQGAPCLQGISGSSATTLTRFVVIEADGTEHELRDQAYDGQPLTYTFSLWSNGAARFTIFKSTDKSDMTFISDTPIYDGCTGPSTSEAGTGYLLLGNGTRYRFIDGLLRIMRDRNGNTLSFTYGTNSNDFRTYRRLVSIQDSLNRTVNITYSDFGVVNPPVLLYDEITYKGFGGNSRSIKVWYSDLGQALRAGFTLQTYNCLFPNLNSGWTCGGSTGNTLIYTDTVVNKVELPNGRSYRLYYNPYRELARVELPKGGAIEYDYSAQNPDYSTIKTVTRYVSERRVFLNANDTTPVGKKTYSFTFFTDTSVTPYVSTTTSVVEYRDPNNLLQSERHLFHGAGNSKSLLGYPQSYKAWDEGLEFQTDIFNGSGTLIKSTTNNWQQRAHVSWWPQPPPYSSGNSQANEPAKDPRIVEADVILADTNQQSKRTFVYSNDLHNNLTDLYEYDFGLGAAGALLRHTHTDFLTTNPVNGINYADPANGGSYTLGDLHLRNLPKEQKVYAVDPSTGGETLFADTAYEYDNYATSDNYHAGLKDWPVITGVAISGLDSSFTSSYAYRGNATAVTRYLVMNGTITSSVSGYAQYDIAGNLVRAIDARGYATNFDFTDRFGSPDGEATSNSSPAELSSVGKASYAFATLVTNAANYTVYTQFDYYLGRPVNAQDANGIVFAASYNDSLDRLTQVIRDFNHLTSKSQTTFAYDDTSRVITTTSDQTTFNDPYPLKSQTIYDGLGRTIETRQYEGGTNYIAVQTQYDALGRAYKTSNPFRPWQGESAIWTTTGLDALNRVTSVTTPDNAVVTTSYSGNAVTVTDQAGKARKSVIDALGRLTSVYEDPNGSNYLTANFYDVLDNLTQVSQGSHTRTFIYDSLKRLTLSTNPESGSVNYQYDSNSNLLVKTDDRGVSVHYEYDALNRVTRRWYNSSNLTTATTNNSPSLPAGVSATDEVKYFYDLQTLPAGAPTFDRGYSTGRLVAITHGGGSAGTYRGYDAQGRILRQYQDSVNYLVEATYNRAGAVLSETYPTVTGYSDRRVVTFNYDGAGRLNSLASAATSYAAGASESSISYAPHGGLTSETYGNGLVHAVAYNNRLQANEIKLGTSAAPTSVLDLLYSYGTTNNNGNLLSVAYSGGGLTYSQSFSYDSLNRLATAAENNGSSWSQTNGYDRYGNRWVVTNGTPSLTFNSQNRVAGWTYDAVGNLKAQDNPLQDGDTLYNYDAENRFTSTGCYVASPGSSACGGAASDGLPVFQARYDGEGQRVRKQSSAYIGSGVDVLFVYDMFGHLISEFNGNQGLCGEGGCPPPVQKEYIYGPSGLAATIEPANGTTYLTPDHLGSPRVLTRASGNVISRHDYLPFGEEVYAGTGGRTTAQGYVASDGMRQKFTGQERDNETGLDFMHARYCSSAQGRFTSADSLGGDISNPQSLNLYAYVLNNPLQWIDPTGHRDVDPDNPDAVWVHDIKKDIYFSVSPEEYKANYNNQEGYELVTNTGADGLVIPLNQLEGSYANDPEYQGLLGSQVYLGTDGRFHAATNVLLNPDTMEVPLDPLTNLVLQAGGNSSIANLGASYVPSTGIIYVTPGVGNPGKGFYLGAGTTTNLDQSSWGGTAGYFHGVGAAITVYPSGDTTNLVGVGLGSGGSVGYSFPVFRVPPAIMNVRVRTINPAAAMPLGDGLSAVDWEKVFGGP
jgi:RHS repeat-associated protein